MNISGVDFIVYGVSDYDKAIVFYRDVLGMTLTHEYGGFWAEFDAGNLTFAISTRFSPSSSGPRIAFAVDDVQSVVEELKVKGITIISEVEDGAVCVKAVVDDKDGNKIILHQRKDGTVG
ncbi:MAG: hypothetical protein A3H59_02010 [Candidatus Jacksonbacteria bacterium RIFCSPLOWO2_02_FULL_43_9]|nr:MAG: Glyoxalase/bleomycin resistance protein/dioxygenase [Parcubacteria group bacterium GW2011_GWA2_43_13]OGY69269.1 MAG: hypothetical protein A3B94_02025 [Candidatus Jacksonbacteria bacterium RIFCSPHIGHO2_02_FULL_43_10]OGY71614.1 MAG: hypothetical protein A2986_01755 [Candidatus Jacksonbacteria bacterium RIFCSPLOWO2_01_FULL_44_13]OGY74353.1 MAG: hypothetical protein A3H59_02010 [Candidatus Jacksonbacteria bacterium RIFCSPLOWO2_02_FULL_43_9]HAZ16612.1 glyoxalase/bleomycin resistance/dioxygen